MHEVLGTRDALQLEKTGSARFQEGALGIFIISVSQRPTDPQRQVGNFVSYESGIAPDSFCMRHDIST